MLGTPVQRAAAQTEPQTGACRRKARKPSQTSVSAHVPKTSVCSLVCVEPHLKGMAAAWQPGGNRAHHRENGGWSCVAQGKACRRAEQSGSCRAPRYLRPSLDFCSATTVHQKLWKLTESGRCDGVDLLRRWRCRPILHSAPSRVLGETQQQNQRHHRWTEESIAAGGSRRAQGQRKLKVKANSCCGSDIRLCHV